MSDREQLVDLRVDAGKEPQINPLQLGAHDRAIRERGLDLLNDLAELGLHGLEVADAVPARATLRVDIVSVDSADEQDQPLGEGACREKAAGSPGWAISIELIASHR